ncbi:hypothetical protein [Bacillus marinisedimentorum]|uniref:hypothetical protein n=1 Tax=Bacillus marinisedimentorum TaxID=1821260 RepID=UPI000871D38E|nr:hypothetical protein [Bacillus marinisedimentorum]
MFGNNLSGCGWVYPAQPVYVQVNHREKRVILGSIAFDRLHHYYPDIKKIHRLASFWAKAELSSPYLYS